ncbi:hypothetical protein A0H76_357 [Hepatospora eriocheir]|uniref:Uncharacterized protein n=1 Tax=Hepatospora eriocheir TaxID=1081669 RepID=A0A1X0QL62_9MICR|nr:hypothetical protein A0H76_357 [Hepatospora eriocheir]
MNNKELATENNTLKEKLTQSIKDNEELKKSTLKTEYYCQVYYSKLILAIDEGINSMENMLKSCKAMRDKVSQSHNILKKINRHKKLYSNEDNKINYSYDKLKSISNDKFTKDECNELIDTFTVSLELINKKFK